MTPFVIRLRSIKLPPSKLELRRFRVRIAALAALVCLLGAGSASAQSIDVSESDGIRTSDAKLPSVTYRAGTSTIEIRAERGVDVHELLVGAKIRPNEDPQTIVDKVNVVRQRLYADREISIVASAPRQSRATDGARLWKYYVYWNRSGRIYFWWSRMLAAVTFMDDVRGTWNYYELFGSTWKYKYQILTGGSLTRALTGYTNMGFDYQPRTYGARADIVMVFFD
jgi:hypothetical protein